VHLTEDLQEPGNEVQVLDEDFFRVLEGVPQDGTDAVLVQQLISQLVGGSHDVADRPQGVLSYLIYDSDLLEYLRMLVVLSH